MSWSTIILAWLALDVLVVLFLIVRARRRHAFNLGVVAGLNIAEQAMHQAGAEQAGVDPEYYAEQLRAARHGLQ